MTATITCPAWCNADFGHANKENENSLHYKYFGDAEGAKVVAWISVSSSGEITSSGFHIDIDEASDPEDMDEIAGWCAAAAAFMREIRGAVVAV